MNPDFTHAGYRDLLSNLLSRGYEVRRYDDAEPDARDLILRHDVDMSLKAAEAIAAIENELGIRSYYFVLLRTELYNLYSEASKRSLERILVLGHEIGLHLDASLYGNDPASLEEAAEKECRILEDISGATVSAISFHRPAESLLGYDRLLAGRPHAYQPKFFKQMGYCSDSRGAWHHGHPLENEAVQQDRALQLLTHPIWWSPKAAEQVQSRLDRFARERYELLRQELGRNCTAYDPSRTS